MKTRIISAIIAIIIVLPFVIVGGNLYAFGVGVVALQAFREFYNLTKSHDKMPNVVTILSILFYICIIYSSICPFLSSNLQNLLIWGSLVVLFPSVIYKKEIYTIKDGFNILGTMLFLGLAFNAFINIRFTGLNLFIYLVSIPMITDSFAYFTGLKFGKHKMSPKISPKKSWEGFFGGMIFGTILPSIIYFNFVGSFDVKVILMTLILSTVGQYGDLLFSKIKRENDIKDFSNLMPGHGGALDRVDSTIAIFLTYILLSSVLF